MPLIDNHTWKEIQRTREEKRQEILAAHAQKREHEARKLAADAGSFVEESIGAFVEHTEEAPVLEGEPQQDVWYRIPLQDGISGDGSEYHIYLKRGTSPYLCLFLSGGGIAWNEFTAARPVTGARMAAREPNFYWDNLRPVTQLMNIGSGIMQISPEKNPFDHWNFVVITYTTGDLHIGDRAFPYPDEEGKEKILHFHGRKNFEAAMKKALKYFPAPEKILLAGDSAGAFAVPAVAGRIADEFYPECRDITLFSDSGQLISDHWAFIVRDVWHADESLWEPIHTDNVTCDWYEELLKTHPGRFRTLYASSTHDYLLSMYYNDMTNKVYRTNAGVRTAFNRQLKNMMKTLRSIDPDIHFFINSWRNPFYTKAQRGTIHTAVRLRYFFTREKGGTSMAEWLRDAVEGRAYDVGV